MARVPPVWNDKRGAEEKPSSQASAWSCRSRGNSIDPGQEYLDGIGDDDIVGVNIPGVPLVAGWTPSSNPSATATWATRRRCHCYCSRGFTE